MAKKSARVPHLPEEMITRILVFVVSVKELLQYKTVCKLWLSIISNPNFIESHRHRAIISAPTPTLLTILNPPPSEHLSFPLIYENYLGASYRRKLQLVNQALDDASAQDLSKSPVHFHRVVLPSPLRPAGEVVNCCNGIICYLQRLSDVLYLWNPSIRMFKRLPDPPTSANKWIAKFSGFGYDSISDDYKVIMIYYREPLVQVYSTKSNSWTESRPAIKNNVNGCYMGPNIVVNGVLYFDAFNELLTFDLHKDVFGLVPFPSGIKRRWSDVLDFKGSVAVVFESESGVDLWTLDDVSGGDQVSWSKKLKIENDVAETNIWLCCYLGAGQFYGRKLLRGYHFLYNILYDYEKRETKYYGLGEREKIHSSLKFDETLVSLDGFITIESNMPN